MLPYVKNNLLTPAELQLYHFLLNNVSQADKVTILVKVRLGDILKVDPLLDDLNPFWKISKKHVDFVICRIDTMDIICVVELDDITHNNKKAKNRDYFVDQALSSAGINLVRIKTPIKNISLNDIDTIDTYINTELAPMCPYCGKKMTPRKNDTTGHRYFGCTNTETNCKYTINIDGVKLPW